ncbi:retrovirus-related Pol polyprotein from transposon TNT 1-94 [Trichonephila clavipes]|nr:retrovirus-related Pol polyprotein from transposon TNT 1-94 [Trichonephila clavipes]
MIENWVASSESLRTTALIIKEKTEDLTHEQALQFAAEDNVKVLWDKIRATFIGRGEDRKIDAGNEHKNIAMKNSEPVGDYIARARGISTKCHSLGLDVSPRELVYHTVRGLNEKFSKVRDILKTQRGKSMKEVLQILREEETTLNLAIKTRMDGINAEAFYSKTKNENESNGKAERANRVLLERARSLLYESKLPLKFWTKTINCSTQVSNVTPRKGKEKVPLEIWTEIENDNSIPLQTTLSPQTGRIQLPVLELNDVQTQIPVRRSERLKSKQMSVHLTNNVPNSYFEAKNSANRQNWKLAMENEFDSINIKFGKPYKNLRNQNQ